MHGWMDGWLFSSHFIVVRVKGGSGANPENPGGNAAEFTTDGSLVLQRAPLIHRFSHTFTHRRILPLVNPMFLDSWRKLENPEQTFVN